jgi:anti-anti-sigma factor
VEIKKEELESGICYTVSGTLSGTQQSAVKLFEEISIATEKGPKEIILDIGRITFVDSMAIGLLVGMLLKCRDKHITLKMKNMPGHLKKIFESTNLNKIFPDLY